MTPTNGDPTTCRDGGLCPPPPDPVGLLLTNRSDLFITMDKEYWLFQSSVEDRAIDDVVDVLERGTWWSGGPEVGEFESLCADLMDRRHAVSFNSGTSALFATLQCLGIEGKEVIVPSFTYPATANAVVAAGGRPVFADIERDSLALDATDVRRKITEETCGIVPIHFAGDVCADIHELGAIAAEHEMFLLEDAAHSDLSAALQRFRMQGRNSDKEFVTWGHNLTMSSITAAIGRAQVARFDEIVEQREDMAAILDDIHSGVDAVATPPAPPARDRVYFLYNLRLPSRELQRELQSYLDDHGIPSRVTYEPVHLTEYYRTEWGYREGDLPVTEDVAGRVLTLPFHLELDDEDLKHIGHCVASFFKS